VIHPYAVWATIEAVKVHAEVGGDPSAMMAMMTTFVNLYSELTGILPGRLGAQTVSHTTAYAKTPSCRAAPSAPSTTSIRAGPGPLTNLLDRAYQMGRDALNPSDKISFFIGPTAASSRCRSRSCRECQLRMVRRRRPGRGAQKRQQKLSSLALAIQMEQVGAAFGMPPDLDLAAAKREVLRDGGWTDVDAITRAAQPAGGAAAAPGVPGAAAGGVPAALTAIPDSQADEPRGSKRAGFTSPGPRSARAWVSS
jgi:hypothetical protein